MDAAMESATLELDKTQWFQILERARMGEVFQEAQSAAIGSPDAMLQAVQSLGAEAVFFTTFVSATGMKQVRENQENRFQVYGIRVLGRLVSTDTKTLLASAQIDYEAYHTLFDRYTETVAKDGRLVEVQMVEENEPISEAQLAQRAATEAYEGLVYELMEDLNKRRNR